MSYDPELPPRPDYGSDARAGGPPQEAGAGPYGGSYRAGGPGQAGPGHQGYERPSYGGPSYGRGHGPMNGPADDERTVAVLTHLSGPIAALISVGWLGFLGPLIVWFVYKDKSPFLRNAAAGAFNFNVTLWLVNVVGWILIATVIGIPLGIVLIIVYWVALLVCHILAAVKSGRGEAYRYPWQLPILK